MKKLFCFLLVGCLLFAFTACGEGESEGTTTTTETATTTSLPTSSGTITKITIGGTTTTAKPQTTTTTEPEDEAPMPDTANLSYRKDDGWRSHPEDYKLLAITLDGPPDGKYVTDTSHTIQMIDTIFACGGGSATINVRTNYLEQRGPIQLEYALERGFELGIYPSDASKEYGVPKLGDGTMSAQEQRDVIKAGMDALKDKLNYTPKFVRPPYLSFDNDTTKRACQSLGLYAVSAGHSSLAPGNGSYGPVDRPDENGKTDVEYMVNCAYDGTVWVLHPAGESMPESFEKALGQIYDKGFRFCTVSELFEYRGKTPELGKCYTEVLR